MIGILAQLLALNVVTGQLAQPELPCVVPYPLKAQLAPQLLKIKIVAVRNRLRHIHAEAGKFHHRVARYDAF
jgi:hypothetical protein